MCLIPSCLPSPYPSLSLQRPTQQLCCSVCLKMPIILTPPPCPTWSDTTAVHVANIHVGHSSRQHVFLGYFTEYCTSQTIETMYTCRHVHVLYMYISQTLTHSVNITCFFLHVKFAMHKQTQLNARHCSLYLSLCVF